MQGCLCTWQHSKNTNTHTYRRSLACRSSKSEASRGVSGCNGCDGGAACSNRGCITWCCTSCSGARCKTSCKRHNRCCNALSMTACCCCCKEARVGLLLDAYSARLGRVAKDGGLINKHVGCVMQIRTVSSIRVLEGRSNKWFCKIILRARERDQDHASCCASCQPQSRRCHVSYYRSTFYTCAMLCVGSWEVAATITQSFATCCTSARVHPFISTLALLIYVLDHSFLVKTKNRRKACLLPPRCTTLPRLACLVLLTSFSAPAI